MKRSSIGYAIVSSVVALCLSGCGSSDLAPAAADTAATQDTTTTTTQAAPRVADVPTTAVPHPRVKPKLTVKPTLTAKPRPKVTTHAVTRPKPRTRRTTTRPAPAQAYYANCTAVRAAGAAPLHSGDPGYSRKLDRDGDGVACET